jgi:hypothetical protein
MLSWSTNVNTNIKHVNNIYFLWNNQIRLGRQNDEFLTSSRYSPVCEMDTKSPSYCDSTYKVFMGKIMRKKVRKVGGAYQFWTWRRWRRRGGGRRPSPPGPRTGSALDTPTRHTLTPLLTHSQKIRPTLLEVAGHLSISFYSKQPFFPNIFVRIYDGAFNWFTIVQYRHYLCIICLKSELKPLS